MKQPSTYKHAFSRPYRIVAVLLCVLYLGGPLKDSISFGLYQVVHSLEQPVAVLGHDVNDTHTSWQHQLVDEEHTHVLVEAVTTIFEALNQHDQQQEIPPAISFFDKHFPIDAKLVFDTKNIRTTYPDQRRVALSEGITLIEIPPPLL